MKRQQAQPSPKQDNSVSITDIATGIHKLPEVDALTALAASFRFMDNNPRIREQMSKIAAVRTAEILEELEEDPDTEMLLVSKRNVRAIFMKAMHETVGLMTLGASNVMTESETLQRQFDSASPQKASLISDGTPELQGEM